MNHIIQILFILILIGCTVAIYFLLRPYTDPDWRGKLEKRFRWARCRREFGRWCYKTNWQGETLACRWEWETP